MELGILAAWLHDSVYLPAANGFRILAKLSWSWISWILWTSVNIILLHSSPAEAALASCSLTSWIQARMPGASVAGWTNTGVSGFRHPAYCRHRPPSASVRVWKGMRRSTHTQQFRRQKFLCCRSSCVERLAVICYRTWTTDISSSHWKDTCLGCRRPRRIVTVVFVHLTYLLTYYF